MTDPRIFSDEELTAYLDAEADERLVSEIETGWSAEIEHRLTQLNVGIAGLREDADKLLLSAPSMPDFTVSPAPSSSNRGFGFGALTGAIAAGLVGAALWFGAGFVQNRAEPWQVIVADYHLLYVPETLAAVPSEAARIPVLSVLSQTLQRDITGLPDVAGISYRRAQPLGFEGNPLVQIAFLSDDGVPMALCILRKEGPASQIEPLELRGMTAAAWSDETHRFLLIGGTDQSVIDAAAQAFSTQL